VNVSIAQTTFQRIFGNDVHDFGNSVHQTIDGGYIIGGSTNIDSLTTNHCLLIKTDEDGALDWSKILFYGVDGIIYSISQTSDSGFILTGMTRGINGHFDWDILVVKTDQNGNVQWTKDIGDSTNQSGQSIIETSDHGYILCGSLFYNSTLYGAPVVKLDSVGNIIWSNYYGVNQVGNQIFETSNGDFVIGGTVDGSNLSLLKINQNGNLMFNKEYQTYSLNNIVSFVPTNDNGFAIVGTSKDPLGNGSYYDFLLLKADFGGNPLWAKCYGGSGDEMGFSINVLSSGGFVLAGRSQPYNSFDVDGCIIKTDSLGNMLAAKGFGGFGYEELHSIKSTIDSGFILTGGTNSFGNNELHVYLVKTDSLFNSGCNDYDFLNFTQKNVTMSYTNNMQVIPALFNAQVIPEIAVSGCTALTVCSTNNIATSIENEQTLIYPNPTTGKITFQFQNDYSNGIIEIFNSIGEIVLVLNYSATNSMAIDLKSLPSGIYFANVLSDDGVSTNKIVLKRD